MTTPPQQLGLTGEELASRLLLKKGYRILARNLKLKYGEIDILAMDHQTIVLVEVKTKSHHLYGLPGEMITLAKQRKLRLLAEIVAQRYSPGQKAADQQVDYRIDVITVDWPNGPTPMLNHYLAAC